MVKRKETAEEARIRMEKAREKKEAEEEANRARIAAKSAAYRQRRQAAAAPTVSASGPSPTASDTDDVSVLSPRSRQRQKRNQKQRAWRAKRKETAAAAAAESEPDQPPVAPPCKRTRRATASSAAAESESAELPERSTTTSSTADGAPAHSPRSARRAADKSRQAASLAKCAAAAKERKAATAAEVNIDSPVDDREQTAASAPDEPSVAPPRKRKQRRRAVSAADFINAAAEHSGGETSAGDGEDDFVDGDAAADDSFIDDRADAGGDDDCGASLYHSVDAKTRAPRLTRQRRRLGEQRLRDAARRSTEHERTPTKRRRASAPPSDPLGESARRLRRASRAEAAAAAADEAAAADYGHCAAPTGVDDETPVTREPRTFISDEYFSPSSKQQAMFADRKRRLKRCNPALHSTHYKHWRHGAPTFRTAAATEACGELQEERVNRRVLFAKKQTAAQREERWQQRCEELLRIRFDDLSPDEQEEYGSGASNFSSGLFVRHMVNKAFAAKKLCIGVINGQFEGLQKVFKDAEIRVRPSRTADGLQALSAADREAALAAFYGGKTGHLWTHEAVGTDRSKYIYTEDEPSDELAARNVDRELKGLPPLAPSKRRECCDDCDTLPGAFDRLHSFMRVLFSGKEPSVDKLQRALSKFEWCAACDAAKRCAPWQPHDLAECTDTIRLLRHLEPHYVGIRSLLRRFYRLRCTHLWLWGVDLSLDHGSLADLHQLLTVGNRNIPESLLAGLRDAARDEDDMLEKEILDKYGHLVTAFDKEVRNFPVHACALCEMLYKKSDLKVYQPLADAFTDDSSCSDVLREVVAALREHGPCTAEQAAEGRPHGSASRALICGPCKRALQKDQVPPVSILNEFGLDAVPDELACLNAFELPLIQRVKLFQTVMKLETLGKSDPAARVGAFRLNCVYLPLPLQRTADYLAETLPRLDNITILVHSLKTRLNKVWSSLVNVDKVARALNWLRENNPHYDGITVNVGAARDEPAPIETCEPRAPADCDDALEPEFTEAEASMLLKPDAAYDTCSVSVQPMQQNLPDQPDAELYVQTKVMGKPKWPNAGEHLDERCYPHLFPHGRGGRDQPRRVKVTPGVYNHQRLRNKNARFRRCAPFLYGALFEKKDREIGQSIYHLLQRTGKMLVAADIKSKKVLQDEDFEARVSTMFGNVRGTNEYWSSKTAELLALDRQLGGATFFMTFSCAEYEWPDMDEFLRLVNSDVDKVELLTTGRLCASDPVSVAQHFYHRWLTFFRTVVRPKDGPIGEVEHFFWRIEYQSRGAPHIHMKAWIKDAPQVGKNTTQEIKDFLQGKITCRLPSKLNNPRLRDLVDRHQTHRHGRTCKRLRGKRTICRFGFPRETSFEPKINSVAQVARSRRTGRAVKLFTVDRRLGEEYINDYNPTLLFAWSANCDIQYIGEVSLVLNRYISSYVSKGEKEAMRELWSSVQKSPTLFGQLKSFALRHLQSREIGAYEAAADLLSQMLCQSSVVVKHLNARPKSERKGKLLKKAEIDQLDDASPDIYSKNIYNDYYPKRSKDLEGTCLYDIFRDFEYTTAEPAARARTASYAQRDGVGWFKLRGSSAVIQLPQLKRDSVEHEERFCWAMLFMFKPWRDESVFDDPLFKRTAKQQLDEFEASGDAPPSYGEFRQSLANMDRAADEAKRLRELPADESDDEATDRVEADDEACASDAAPPPDNDVAPMSAEQLDELRSSLNEGQALIYDSVCETVEHIARHDSGECLCAKKPSPVRQYVSGVGGTGKSFLIAAICKRLRSFACRRDSAAVAAPTGLAAFNVGGETCHRFWGLQVQHGRAPPYKPLGRDKQKELKQRWRAASVVIVDELSMVSNWMLAAILQRFVDAFNGIDVDPPLFGSMNLLFFGDVLQLQPVNADYFFVPYRTPLGLPVDLWSGFSCHELTQNMRHATDRAFGELCEAVRFGTFTEAQAELLRSRVVKLPDKEISSIVAKFIELAEEDPSIVCLLPTNALCAAFNEEYLAAKKIPVVPLVATDTDANGVPLAMKRRGPKGADAARIVEKKSSETAGLEMELKLGEGARVMLRRNVDVAKGLVNGAIGTVTRLVWSDCGQVLSVEVKFDVLSAPIKVQRVSADFELTGGVIVARKQFPLCLASAITIHKSQACACPLGCVPFARWQGVTLNSIFVDLGEESFGAAMPYVAISRVRRLDGLHLIDFDPRSIYCNTDAYDEYCRQRKSCGLPDPPPCNQPPPSVRDLPPKQSAPKFVTCEWAAPVATDKPAKPERRVPASSSAQPRAVMTLKNEGNTCFANAVVQLLMRLPEFNAALMADAAAAAASADVGPSNAVVRPADAAVRARLRDLYQQFLHPRGDAATATPLLQALRLDPAYARFSDGRPHDARDFLEALLSCMPPPVVDMFQSHEQSIRTCNRCGSPTQTDVDGMFVDSRCAEGNDVAIFADTLLLPDHVQVHCFYCRAERWHTETHARVCYDFSRFLVIDILRYGYNTTTKLPFERPIRLTGFAARELFPFGGDNFRVVGGVMYTSHPTAHYWAVVRAADGNYWDRLNDALVDKDVKIFATLLRNVRLLFLRRVDAAGMSCRSDAWFRTRPLQTMVMEAAALTVATTTSLARARRRLAVESGRAAAAGEAAVRFAVLWWAAREQYAAGKRGAAGTSTSQRGARGRGRGSRAGRGRGRGRGRAPDD